jgi:hypothetical protein
MKDVMLTCTVCGLNFYGKACPKCGGNGRPAKAAAFGKLEYAILGVLVVVGLVLVWAWNELPETPRETKSLTSGQVEYLNDLVKEGLLDIRAEGHKVFVAPAFWYGADHTLKENLSAALALRCAQLRGDQRYWIEVIDNQSAKKLADWDDLHGLRVQ